MPDDYEVGFAKPPKAHQFKPGQSGNPKGRPRGAKRHKSSEEMRREFMGAAEQELTVSLNGRKQKMPAIHAIHQQLIAKALKGDFRSMKLVSDTYAKSVIMDEDQRMQLLETLLVVQRAEEADIKAQLALMTPEKKARRAAFEEDGGRAAFEEALRARAKTGQS